MIDKKPSDLIPELQGRLPIRVELDALTADDFERILTEPDASLCKQYVALLKTEGIELEFTDDGIKRISEIAWQVNERTENIGARRLHTVMERLLEETSFNARADILFHHLLINVLISRIMINLCVILAFSDLLNYFFECFAT